MSKPALEGTQCTDSLTAHSLQSVTGLNLILSLLLNSLSLLYAVSQPATSECLKCPSELLDHLLLLNLLSTLSHWQCDQLSTDACCSADLCKLSSYSINELLCFELRLTGTVSHWSSLYSLPALKHTQHPSHLLTDLDTWQTLCRHVMPWFMLTLVNDYMQMLVIAWCYGILETQLLSLQATIALHAKVTRLWLVTQNCTSHMWHRQKIKLCNLYNIDCHYCHVSKHGTL